MSSQKYHVGDTVAHTTRVGSVDRRRIGTVTSVTKASVQVSFPDMNGPVWLAIGRAVELIAGDPKPRTQRQVPEVVEAVPVEAPALAPVSPDDVLARLESSGADLVALWRALGAGLTDRKRRAVTEADDAVSRAEADVRDAESLLADARRTLAAAKARAQDARSELAVVEREMGVVR